MTFTYALITPSFAGDFERCKLLVESVERCIGTDHPYYIIVPTPDLPVFETLKTRSKLNISLIPEESLMPWYVFRTPFSKKWRVNLFGMPTRGWITQQFCKLMIATKIKEEVLVILDSDVCFIRPLDLNQFAKDEDVRLLCVPNRGKNNPKQRRWHRLSAKLLGIPPTDYFGSGYIGNVVTWRRSIVLRLIDHLRKNHIFWRLAILNQPTFSEYILYGIYAEQLLGMKGHYKEADKGVTEYWAPRPMTDDGIHAFFDEINEEFAIMISAKAGIAADRYLALIRAQWEKYGVA
jgi:hypothetical protein